MQSSRTEVLVTNYGSILASRMNAQDDHDTRHFLDAFQYTGARTARVGQTSSV